MQGAERFGDLPKVMQLDGGKTRDQAGPVGFRIRIYIFVFNEYIIHIP